MPFSAHSCKSYAARAVRVAFVAVFTPSYFVARRPNVDASFASARPDREDGGLPVRRPRLDRAMDIAAPWRTTAYGPTAAVPYVRRKRVLEESGSCREGQRTGLVANSRNRPTAAPYRVADRGRSIAVSTRCCRSCPREADLCGLAGFNRLGRHPARPGASQVWSGRRA